MTACRPLESDIQPQKSQPKVIATPPTEHELKGKFGWQYIITDSYKVQPEVVENQLSQKVSLSQ